MGGVGGRPATHSEGALSLVACCDPQGTYVWARSGGFRFLELPCSDDKLCEGGHVSTCVHEPGTRRPFLRLRSLLSPFPCWKVCEVTTGYLMSVCDGPGAILRAWGAPVAGQVEVLSCGASCQLGCCRTAVRLRLTENCALPAWSLGVRAQGASVVGPGAAPLGR